MRLDETKPEFIGFVSRHEDALKRYVTRRLSDVGDAEDVVIETFAIAWQHRDKRPQSEHELAWLLAISFRVLSNHRRSRDRRERLRLRFSLERPLNTWADSTCERGTVSLQSYIKRLSRRDQELLQLLYWEELGHKDAAAVLGISENAVALRASRARKRLQVLISVEGTGL